MDRNASLLALLADVNGQKETLRAQLFEMSQEVEQLKQTVSILEARQAPAAPAEPTPENLP